MSGFHFYEESRIIKFMEAESRRVTVGGLGRGNGDVLPNRCKVSVMQNEPTLQFSSATL